MECKSCGANVRITDKFCSFCRSLIEAPKSSVETSQHTTATTRVVTESKAINYDVLNLLVIEDKYDEIDFDLSSNTAANSMKTYVNKGGSISELEKSYVLANKIDYYESLDKDEILKTYSEKIKKYSGKDICCLKRSELQALERKMSLYEFNYYLKVLKDRVFNKEGIMLSDSDLLDKINSDRNIEVFAICSYDFWDKKTVELDRQNKVEYEQRIKKINNKKKTGKIIIWTFVGVFIATFIICFWVIFSVSIRSSVSIASTSSSYY